MVGGGGKSYIITFHFYFRYLDKFTQILHPWTNNTKNKEYF